MSFPSMSIRLLVKLPSGIVNLAASPFAGASRRDTI